jgi:selenocysteine-specific translation elongation factor
VKFDDYHRALIPKTSLAIYYFEQDDTAVVVCVIDARRHPRLIRDFVRGRRVR